MDFIFVILIHVYSCLAYPLECPKPAQWSTRARALCPDSSKYYCLQNENIDGFTESCSRMNDAQPGSKIILRGDMDVGPCSFDRYQPWPIIYKTNESSGCIFMKTHCTDEGQLVYQFGDTNTDSTCRCDYTKGYDFLFKPKHPCFCVPRIEDCSCYLKTCSQSNPVNSRDYKCLIREKVLPGNTCSLIKTGSKNISNQHTMNGVFQQQESNELPVLTFSKDAATSVTVLMLPLLGLFIAYVFFNERIIILCKKGCETNWNKSGESVMDEPEVPQARNNRYTSWQVNLTLDEKIEDQSIKEENLTPKLDDNQEMSTALPPKQTSYRKEERQSTVDRKMAYAPETHQDVYERYTTLPQRKKSNTENGARPKVECAAPEPKIHQDKKSEDVYERYTTLPKRKTSATESEEKCKVEIVPPETEPPQDKHKLYSSLFQRKACDTKTNKTPSKVSSVAPEIETLKDEQKLYTSLSTRKTVNTKSEIGSLASEPESQQNIHDQNTPKREGSLEMPLFKSFQASKLGDDVEINKGCFISENKLLLIQEDAYYLYVCDLDGSNAFPIKLCYKAECVTPYKRNQALVLDRNGVIQILNLSDLTLGKQITIDRTECSSITSLGEHIWISYENVLAKIDINGDVLQMKKTNFRPCDICLSKRGYVYCADDNSDKVFVLKYNGEVSMAIGDNDLRGTRGVAVDHKNQVYIAGKMSENIIRISSDRNHHIIVLKAEHGIDQPIGLSYNSDARLLMVVNENGKTIDLYKHR